ncbi:hypothetical protein ACFSTA_10340 [Ornithinibacillus salinisoli]|uniref:Uncharacterized protein n=1 Tax=Ornithinibacillus salinisoli TaxID=1848459 RepID=A0ABW4W1X4_9BACI
MNFYTKQLDFSVSKVYGDNIISLEHNGIPLVLEKIEKTNTPSPSNVVLGIQSENIHDDFTRLKAKQVKILLMNQSLVLPDISL